MKWFLAALISMLCWGSADLFYKKSTDENDPLSHLKIAVWVGLIMGACSIALLFFAPTGLSAESFAVSALKYSPASLAYIISMVIGYAGIRYLEVSIISPVQNSSGALSVVVMCIFFVTTGKMNAFWDEFSILDVIGTIVVIIGVIALAIVDKHKKDGPAKGLVAISAPAIIFPLMYCVFDTIGTAADGIILNEETGAGLGMTDVLVLYGLTFMLAGIVLWIILLKKTKRTYNPFGKSERSKMIAACCEEAGQVFYVMAMTSKPMLAAPMISAYCIVSVVLLRIFVKEKLTKSRYICVVTVIIGVVILGISQGLNP